MSEKLIEKWVSEYLAESVWEVRENANVNRSYTALMSYVVEKAMRALIPKYFPEKAVKLHLDGWIHIHKLPHSLFIPYCAGWSTERILRMGLKTPSISAKPAKHADVLVDHLVNFLYCIAQEWTGAQALSAIDLYLAPFAEHDRLDYKRVKQCVQRFIYDLNFTGRLGMQTPFTNVMLTCGAIEEYMDLPAIVGGEVVGTLGDYYHRVPEVVKAFCEVYLEGDATGRPFTFPIPTVPVTPDFWKFPEMDMIWLATARRGSFYFLNGYSIDVAQLFSMCCRLVINTAKVVHKNSYREKLEEIEGELFKMKHIPRGVWAIPDATGSIGVVTINLARIAMEAVKRGDEKYVFDILQDLFRVARECLMTMRRRYEKSLESGLMPMTRMYLGHFMNHYNTIGFVALPEFSSILLQRPRLWYIEDPRGAKEVCKLYRSVLEFANKICEEFESEDGVLYNIELVPAESAAYRLARLDYEKYPEFRSYIPVEAPFGSEGEKVPFYSSLITPSYSTWDLRLQLEVESEIQPLFTGGVMKHIFLGTKLEVEQVRRFVENICKTTRIVYFSLTPVMSVCQKCGWWDIGIYARCPRCGNEMIDVYSRIVGYYRPVKLWNVGRKAEFKSRRHLREEDVEKVVLM